MAATAGSIYQVILTNHINNNPPNCDPQRTAENFTTYFNRMQGQGLPPDIGATESDSAYLTRLATYVIPTSIGRTTVSATNLTSSYSTLTNTTVLGLPYSSSATALTPLVSTGSCYVQFASPNLFFAYDGVNWHSCSLA